MSGNQVAEKRYELPTGWTSLEMSEVGRWYGGGTPSKANPRFWTGGNIPWVSPKDMKFDVITDAQDHITEEAVAQSATNLVEPGSVLVVARSGILQHTLPVAVTQRQVALNQDLKAVTPREHIRSDYLALALKAFEREILHTCTKTGTTVQSLELSAFLRFKIPVAPLLEQERIVEEVEKQFTRLEAGMAALQRMQVNLKRYRASVLNAACEGELVPTEIQLQKLTGDAQQRFESGDKLLKRILVDRRQDWDDNYRYKEPVAPVTTSFSSPPKGWTIASLEQLTSAARPICYGILMPKENVANGVLFVKVKDMKGDRIDLGGLHRTTPEIAAKYARASLKTGDLLLSIRGTYGRVAEVPKELEGGNITQDTARLAVTPLIDHRYVAIYIRNTNSQNYLKRIARGVAVKGVNIGDVKPMPIALPPFAEQRRIVAEVERRLSVVDALESAVFANIQRAIRLRQSVLQRAFVGGLVSQNPREESADKLFARIRSQPEQVGKRMLKTHRAEPPNPDQLILPMAEFKTAKSALESALALRPHVSTAKELFGGAHFEREQVYSFYDAIADSSDAIGRLSAGRSAASIKPHPRGEAQKSQPPLRLHELWVKKFKNLEDYIVIFDPRHALDVLLGWNGTGKSNLFEVLIVIFRDLYKWQSKDKWTPQEGLEGYRIRYEMDGRIVEITWDSDSRRPTAKVAIQRNDDASEADFEVCKREEIPLPHFVFGYYSGPSNRFAELFSEPKQDHYDRLLKQKIDDEETLANLLEQRRFFNAETHHAKYALLSFFYHDDPAIQRFLKKHLRIEDLESVLFVLKRPRWHRNNNPEDFWGARGLLRPVLERLRKHSVAQMVLPQTVDDGFQEATRDHYFLLLPTKKHLQALASEYADPTSFFVALESTDFSSIIHEVRIRVRISATSTKQTVVTFKEMSEGEQQLLMVLGLLRFTKMSQSLVLLDEPDTHLNPHWQLGYLVLLLEALVGDSSDQESSNRIPIEKLETRLTSQVLLSTHDPLAIAGLLKQNIHLLKRRDKTEECLAVRPDEDPRGMGFTGILTSEMFGLKSDLDDETLNLLDKHAALVGKKTLSASEEKKLETITAEVEHLGFKSASSDPYYRAYLQALARRRKARELLAKPSWTKEDIETLGEETDEILIEIEQEDTSE